MVVVIVNYRTGRLVVDCLRSLVPEATANPGMRVVVVDNCSGDDSVEVIGAAIGAEFRAFAELLCAPRNGGFAYGNNLAIRRAMSSATPPEFFWLLNPDTTVRPRSLGALLEFMQANPLAGICGGGIEEADGSFWPYAFRFHSVLSEFEEGIAFGPVSKLLSRITVRRRMGREPEKVDWVPGCTMMIRRDVVAATGPMDEGFFLYFEETDYCRTAKRAGFECWYVPQSVVMHIAGQSTGVTAKTDAPRRLPDYWFDSRRRYFQKHHGRFYACLADLAWITGHCLNRLRCRLQRRPRRFPPHLLRDFVRHSSLLGRSTSLRCQPGPQLAGQTAEVKN